MNTKLQYTIAGVILLMATSMTAQRAAKFWWFDAGLKGQYGATSMFNQTLGDSDTWRYDVGTGYSFGGKIGINKGTSGLTIDVMAATGSAVFEDARVATAVVPTELTYKTLDIYTLYRNNRQLGYVEIGPKFSIFNSAEYNDGGAELMDVTSFYEGNNVNAVLGFGAYFLGSDGAFSGIIGLRFEYGLTDIVNTSGHVSGTPVQDPTIDTGASVTHPLFAGISFELNWGLGYYGKASCGGRSKFIKF